jgi:hydroxyacylglutathione hydrolase
VTANELGKMLYNSLHNKFLKLPDETFVYPAYGAGPMCGKALSGEAVSTLWGQKLYNYALQPMTREAFIEMVTADQREAPAYFGYNASLNRQERLTLKESMSKSMKALDLNEVIALQKYGAQIIDVRVMTEFSRAHIQNAINIGLDERFATWAVTVLDKNTPVIIVT